MSDRRALAAALAPVLTVALWAGAGAIGQKQGKPRPEPADNSYCYACHINYKREPLADKHRRVGVGCASCHGESDKHSSDENNVTPPDIMFAEEKVNAACVRCHTPAAMAAKARRTRSAAHKLVLALTPEPRVRASPTCTTCHGSHRLEVRTRRWDKTTGKLISDDGVRMIR
jgi:hypothetical protein